MIFSLRRLALTGLALIVLLPHLKAEAEASLPAPESSSICGYLQPPKADSAPRFSEPWMELFVDETEELILLRPVSKETHQSFQTLRNRNASAYGCLIGHFAPTPKRDERVFLADLFFPLNPAVRVSSQFAPDTEH